ncbi:hypothetical protein H5410_016799 [Solanum commersonii]|uniref:Uncharacterized protein n=1 Tax=Solanum commersonii TaxID=4109 RepID=A0A9J5ZYQ7_SOLCO|nr:hypothetical protein H5410_016799 [Solanum commersonii]
MERHGKKELLKLLEYVKKYHLHHISIDRKGINVKNEWSEDIAEFVSYIIRWFTLLDTSQIITHICHAILYKVMKVQKLSKSDGVNSAILKAANKIIIFFLMKIK